jgi:hypothetical protein
MLKTILNNWLIPAILLIVTLLAAYFFGDGWAGVIVAALFCVTLAGAILVILQEQRKLYRENRISRAKLIRNALFQIAGILLAMALASLLGRWLAEAATQQISNGLIKFIAGMILGLLAGMGVGFLVKQMWGRLAGRG